MHNLYDGWQQDQDDTAGGMDGARTSGGRRRLLAGATGALALAASGLLLPEWLDEKAAAGTHPVRRIQHRTDKRRTKRRHRLEHRREHDAKAPRSPWFRGVEFQVEAVGYRPIKVERYIVLETGALRFAETKTFGPGSTESFRDPTFGPTALWINGRYWVYGENPPLGYPSLTLGYGGRIDRGGWSEGTTAFSGGMQVGDARAMQVDGFTFQASRVADSDDYKVFFLHVFAPSS